MLKQFFQLQQQIVLGLGEQVKDLKHFDLIFIHTGSGLFWTFEKLTKWWCLLHTFPSRSKNWVSTKIRSCCSWRNPLWCSGICWSLITCVCKSKLNLQNPHINQQAVILTFTLIPMLLNVFFIYSFDSNEQSWAELEIWRITVVLIYRAAVFLNGLVVFVSSMHHPWSGLCT